MIRYKLRNRRPPKCPLCGEQVIGEAAVVLENVTWLEGTVDQPRSRELYRGNQVHEKCIPMHLRQKET